LPAGVPRSYNIIGVDTEAGTGRAHVRRMQNTLFDRPIWGAGTFDYSNRSYVDFALAPPLEVRPPGLDERLRLEAADAFLGRREWRQVIDILEPSRREPEARRYILRALQELGDPNLIMNTLYPPTNAPEAITVGGALLESGSASQRAAFIRMVEAAGWVDPSLQTILQRIRLKV